MKTSETPTKPNIVYEILEAHLHKERERIRAEIHNYPPPIPACDAQFNYLIDQRALVTQELRQVQAIPFPAENFDEEESFLRRIIVDSGILSQTTKTYLLKELDQWASFHPTL